MIGTISTGFQTDQPDPFAKTGGTPNLTARLIKGFVRDHLSLWMIQSEDVQKAFCEWLTDHVKREASKITIRKELKDIRAFAKKNDLHLLEVHAEKLMLDTRNNVRNLLRNHSISHFWSQDTVERLANYFGDSESEDSVTVTEYEATQLFLLTCMCGLRTSEWKTAQLVLPPCDTLPGETRALPHLVIDTAKTRAEGGRKRYLILDAFSNGQLDLLNQSLQFYQAAPSGTRSQLIVRFRAVMAHLYRNDPEALALIKELDFRSARKLYTVEFRRAGNTAKEVAAALGHTSTQQVRYYNQGDISGDRQTSLPLARPPAAAEKEIKDPLDSLNKARQAAGHKPISGYPTLPDIQTPDQPKDSDSSDNSAGRNLINKL